MSHSPWANFAHFLNNALNIFFPCVRVTNCAQGPVLSVWGRASNFPWDPSLCCLKSTCQMSLGVRSRLCTMGGSAPGVRLCPSQCTIPEGTVCRSIGDLNSESFQPGVLEFTLLLPALFWLLLLSPYLSWSLSSPAFSLSAPAMILHHSSVPVTVVCSPLCLPLSCWPSWVSLSPCSCLLP